MLRLLFLILLSVWLFWAGAEWRARAW